MRALSSADPATSALLLASVLVTSIALGALALAAWRDHADALEGAVTLSKQVSRLVEEHTQRYVSAPEQALRRLDERFAEVPVAQLGAERVRLVAEGIAGELPQVSSLFVADTEGRVVMLTGHASFAPINVADRQYFRVHLIEDRRDTVVGPQILSREPVPRHVFTISRPLIRDGKVAGIVAATLDVTFFASFYNSLNLGPDAVCSVFNEEGWLVARQQAGEPALISRNFSHLPLFTERLPLGPTGTFVREGIMDGRKRVFAYRKVTGLPLVIVAGLPLDGVVAGWHARTLRNTAMVLALLGVVQGALWLTWRGVRRERTLADGLRRALDDNVTLFNEIHHRVKNNMQIVSSMLMIEQIRAGQGPLAERLQLVADRVSSMALVHTMLYERHEASCVDISAYLAGLCRNLAEGHGAAERGIRIEVNVDDTCLAMENAVPLGLLVNEAVVNALKHAFPGGRVGTIRVNFHGTHSGEFSLSVMDDGAGMALLPKAGHGIGTTLIRSLAGQLDADATLSGGPDGHGTILRVRSGQRAAGPQAVLPPQPAFA